MIKMSEIKVEPSQVRSVASQIRGAAGSLNSSNNISTDSVSSLVGCYKAISATQALDHISSQLNAAISSYAAAFDNLAESFEETDRHIAGD